MPRALIYARLSKPGTVPNVDAAVNTAWGKDVHRMKTEKTDPLLIRQAAELLRSARHAVVLTGAGISTPSGIPDFRSQGTGQWTKDDPMVVASLTSFLRRPERFYNWLRPLLIQTWDASPNLAHLALAEMEVRGVVKAVVTQNIDGLHRAAGSKNVIEVHGSLDTMECPSCGKNYPALDFKEAMLDAARLPECPSCGRTVKPGIVLFEEFLPAHAWQAAEEHCTEADVLLVVGSSLAVMPSAGLPYYTLQHGGKVVINTYSPTPLDSQAAVLLPFDVAETLPAILQALGETR